MKVVTGIICHETSTFTPVATNWASYHERFGYLHGDEIQAKFRGTNTPIGGFIEGAEVHGFELVHTVCAEPQPSGPTPRDIFDTIMGEVLDAIRSAGAIDGILLQLHGSMVAEDIPDADGHVLAAVREVVGPNLPVIAQLDIHANVSPLMVEQADVLIGRETYPEVDMALRGRECADVLVKIVREGLHPTMALHQIPMAWGMNQITAHPPMKEAIDRLHEIEARPGVVCASISTCYALQDVPHMGASVHVVTDNDLALAQRHADELASWIYERRETWQLPLPSTRDTLRDSAPDAPLPMIFADMQDNTGGGTPGDGTGLLRTFLDEGLDKACVLYIVDPEAVHTCHAAGVGADLTLPIGAKTSPLQGEPVTMHVRVEAISDGQFRYHGPMFKGLEGTMGPSAYIRQDGIHVLLVSLREQPFDTAFSESMGLDPRQMSYIGIKSAAHFRSGFESWSGTIHVVGEPCVHSHLTYRNLERDLFPITTSSTS